MTNIYEKAKGIESKIIKNYGGKAKEKGFEIVEIDDYCPADLVVKKGNEYFCLEVKSRIGKYNLDFFKNRGMSCGTFKLKKCKELYGVNSMMLITVTSDGYILKGIANSSTPTEKFMIPSTTSFENKKKIKRELFIIKDFTIEEEKYDRFYGKEKTKPIEETQESKIIKELFNF